MELLQVICYNPFVNAILDKPLILNAAKSFVSITKVKYMLISAKSQLIMPNLKIWHFINSFNGMQPMLF
jgi:hypothetical protein